MFWRKRQINESEEIVLSKKDFDHLLVELSWIEAGILPNSIVKDKAAKLRTQLKDAVTNQL